MLLDGQRTTHLAVALPCSDVLPIEVSLVLRGVARAVEIDGVMKDTNDIISRQHTHERIVFGNNEFGEGCTETGRTTATLLPRYKKGRMVRN